MKTKKNPVVTEMQVRARELAIEVLSNELDEADVTQEDLSDDELDAFKDELESIIDQLEKLV